MTRRDLLVLLAAASAKGAAPRRVDLPSRQVRVDLFTAGLELDPSDFAQSMRNASVTTVTISAKSYEGYSYHDTQVGVRHPALKRDLFGELVQACKQEGLAVHYSYPLEADNLLYRKHPEWRILFTPLLCLNSPYLDQVVRHNREILTQYPVDGVYFQAFTQPPCECQWCKGLSAAERATRVENTLSSLVKGAVSYGGRPLTAVRDESEAFTHFEVYEEFDDHNIRFLRTLGKDCLGVVEQTKRSTCLRLVANGAHVCVAPSKLNPAVYQGIGEVYKKLEALEKWTRNCRAVADIGVYSKIPYQPVLIELHQQFDILDERSDLALYKLLLLHDRLPVEGYLDRGGAAILSSPGGTHASGGTVKLHSDTFGDMQQFVLESPFAALEQGRSSEILATCEGHPFIVRKAGLVSVATRLTALPTPVLGALIRALMPRPSVIAPNLPATARVTMLEQRTQGNLRRIVHILCDGVLENIQLSVSLPQHPLGVVLIPSEKPLEFKHNEFYTTFVVPRVEGHQAIAFE